MNDGQFCTSNKMKGEGNETVVKMFVQNNYTSEAHILLFNRFVILHTLSEQRFTTYFTSSE